MAVKIQNDILNQMVCQGKMVSKLVEDQKYQEFIQTQTWRLPVFILIPVVTILILALIVFVG